MKRVTVSVMLVVALVFLEAAAQAVPISSDHSISLKFRPGHNRIVREGFFSNNGRMESDYVFNARAGQRLKIGLEEIAPRGHNAEDTLVTMYHITFPSGQAYGMKGYDPFDGKLTETGVYHVTVQVNTMASEGNSGRYRLTLVRL